MKTLYIIGNGFDIAHGLETRYWSLRTYIEQRDPNFLALFEELYGIRPLDDTEPWYTLEAQERWNKSVDHSLWCNFEKMMGAPDVESMLGQSVAATEGMRTVGIRHHMDIFWKEQFGFINKLSGYVKEWIENVDVDKVKCQKNSLCNSEDIFLNFNYTDVLERVYNIENVLHIHGGVGSVSKISPIMGHCSKKTIEQHQKWAKEADQLFEEAEASIQEAIANYLETIYKDTEKLILENQSFFDGLNIVNHVVIIGCSAGEADIPYFEEILKKVDVNTKWTVYWYGEESYNQLKNALAEVKDNAIEYIHSDEFWDKKK